MSQQPSQSAASARGGCHAHPSSLPVGSAFSALPQASPGAGSILSPSIRQSFGRLDSVQAKKASPDGADEGAKGSTSLQDLGRIIAPGGRSCDGGGGGMPWAGVPRLQMATL